MILKSRLTRAAALLLSCALVGVCADQCVNIYNELDHSGRMDEYWTGTNQLNMEVHDTYEKLWLVGAMYLRNLDEKGNFIGTRELEKQTMDYLRTVGCVDEKGRLTIDVPEGYEYKVSWGRNALTNTTKTVDQLKEQCSVTYEKGTVYWDHRLGGYGEMNCKVTNYGMTYYYAEGRGVALFDFDTDGLNSYVDELGARIYYKTDGTTPLPESRYIEDKLDFDNRIWGDSDEEYDVVYYEPDWIDYSEAPDVEAFHADDVDMDETPTEAVTVPVENATEDPFSEVFANAPDNEQYYCYFPSSNSLVPVKLDKFTIDQVNDYDLTIAVSPPAKLVEQVDKYMTAMREDEKAAVRKVCTLIPLGVIALILAAYVLINGGYDPKEKKCTLGSADKVFAELPIVLGLSAAIAVVSLLSYDIFADVMAFLKDVWGVSNGAAMIGIVCGCAFGVILLMLDTIIIRLRCGCFWRTTLVGRIVGYFVRLLRRLGDGLFDSTIDRRMMRSDQTVLRFLGRTAVFVGVEIGVLIMSAIVESAVSAIFGTAILLCAYVAFSLVEMRDLIALYRHIDSINSGDYSRKDVKRDSVIYVPTEKLNSISDGIQRAVDSQLRSERMKIDLVTNVSHDLKTPLTSIISYIDLLSSEELSPTARDYVTIIDSKSQHLKSMVADLFDLAKATSRSDINAEELDAVILTEQVLGDMADKIESSGREIRRDIQTDPAPIFAEGKRMYRVLQNILDNALKYSLEGTRIYVTLRVTDGACTIAVKNIASYEMDFTPEEIMERFTRGDQSRSTEGNGLGLSIAKSFTEACGGTFTVTVDGDVFVAEVNLPLIIRNA